MTWVCPCNGCKKAAKQERERISKLIEDINIDTPAQPNALGMKILILDLINPKSEAKK